MIRYVYGDVLETEEVVIAHGCNTLGVMGAGVAWQLRSRYPHMYRMYHKQCVLGEFNVGDYWVYYAPDGHRIACLATQRNIGTTRPMAKVEWIEQSMTKLVTWLVANGYNSFAMPKIGCRLGGLRWEDVEPVVQRVTGTSVTAVVYNFP